MHNRSRTKSGVTGPVLALPAVQTSAFGLCGCVQSMVSSTTLIRRPCMIRPSKHQEEYSYSHTYWLGTVHVSSLCATNNGARSSLLRSFAPQIPFLSGYCHPSTCDCSQRCCRLSPRDLHSVDGIHSTEVGCSAFGIRTHNHSDSTQFIAGIGCAVLMSAGACKAGTRVTVHTCPTVQHWATRTVRLSRGIDSCNKRGGSTLRSMKAAVTTGSPLL